MDEIIINANTIEYMQTIESNSIDLIIADPPYFKICGDFDFNTWKTQEEYLEWCREWLNESKRILKNSGTLILWGGVGKKHLVFAKLAILIEEEEILIRQNWVTQKNTRGIGTKRNYMSTREEFLFLTKTNDYTFNVPYLEERSTRKDLGADGKPRKNDFKRVSNVWSDITEASQSSIERCEHPTVKAQKLCDRLIQTHSNENDLIFIPFVGSGSAIISAIRNKRKVSGTELLAKYADLAKKRTIELVEKLGIINK